MSNCLNCDKVCHQFPGKREKKFCDSDCRTTYWQRQRREQVKANNKVEGFMKKPLAKNSVKKKSKTKKLVVKNNIRELVPDIAIKAIRSEKIPPERDTIMGRKVWKQEQDKRIQELESLLGYPV